MLLKICGLRDYENVQAIDTTISPDWLGFIFYPISPRFVGNIALPATQAKKIGVFVNEIPCNIVQLAKQYALTGVQLHAEESPQDCTYLRSQNLLVIKAFSIGETFPTDLVASYVGKADYFIFDTKGKAHGGNGVTFNWDLLRNYQESTPFLLSGGIGLENINDLHAFKHTACIGIDVNSKFEIAPTIKDIALLQQFKTLLPHTFLPV